MQSTITLQSATEREARLRRSAILTALYGLGIVACVALGLWLMIAFSLPELFFGALAAGAALSDPMRRHLHDIF